MAAIPDITKVQRRIPTGRAPIARLDIRDVGAGYQAGADILAGIAERETNNQVAKADANMSIALTETMGSFDQDPDYGAFDKRYKEDTEKRLGEIAATISDGAARNEFIQRNRPRVAAGLEKVQAKALGLKVEDERGQLITITDGLLKSGTESGDIAGTNELFNKNLDSAVESRYVDADAAAKMRIDFKHRLATGRIERLPPEQRVDALKQPWAKKYLPANTYATLLRKAEEETRTGKSQATVDNYMAKDYDRTEAMNRIAKIKDPELRAETETRFDYVLGKQQKAELEAQSELTDKWFDKIALGENTIDDIKAADDWDAMGATVQSNMINAQKVSVSATKVPPSIEHEDKLNQLLIDAQRGRPKAGIELRGYVLKYQSEMSWEQFKRWSKVSIEGSVPPEIKSGITDQQAIAARYPKSDDAERRRVIMGEMGEWRKWFIETHKKEPASKDRDQFLDEQALNYDAGFWYIEKPVRVMEAEERIEVIQSMKEDIPESFNKALNYFRKQGYVPQQSELMAKIKQIEMDKETKRLEAAR